GARVSGAVDVRPVTDDADRETFVGIVNAVTPDEPTSLDYLAWEDATYPGSARFLGTLDGQPAGMASVGRIFSHGPEFDALWAIINVLPEARERGLGSGLLNRVREVGADRGKGWLHIPTSEERPEGASFLERRGFEELERYKVARLDLAGLEPPALAI